LASCAFALGVLAITLAVALAVALDGQPGSHRAVPIRKVADPAPPYAPKAPAKMRGHDLRRDSKPHVHRKEARQLEDEGMPKAHELTPEVTAEPITEPAPEATPPTPAPPTSATAEFGL
jgi:hypothetical protein